MPDFEAYHRSITEELYSTKNRIRNLVKHWPTDGESKEAALRSLLRKHLPKAFFVGRGFIVNKDKSSTQIDILIIDSTKPTLFKDGDLVIVTPDAVRAIIEVKTKLNTSKGYTETVEKLLRIEDLCRETTGKDSIWCGLFVFDGESNIEKPLQAAAEAYISTGRTIHSISVGRKLFIRYWDRGADVNSGSRGQVWHSYELPEVAPSYFLGNLIDWISHVDHDTANFAWFPALGGKEQYRKQYVVLGQSKPRNF